MFPLEVGEGEEPPDNINSILEMEVGAPGKLVVFMNAKSFRG